MMHSPEPYLTARGVEAAIKEAAKKAAQADPSIDTSKRISVGVLQPIPEPNLF